MANSFIKWFSELDKKSGQIAGGKGANLAEMTNADLPIPPGFVITTDAYKEFVKPIRKQIEEILESIDVDNTAELDEKAKQIREIMIATKMPDNLKEDILEAYGDLSLDKNALRAATNDALSILKHSHEPIFVAVRSSATTEDLEDSSFAGQQETYLNVKGNDDLIKKVKRVLASLFTARAIYYRKKRGFSKEKFALAAIVQKMIDAEKSGVIFSKNPVKNNDDVLVEAVFGLGEGIVSGKINPDTYELSRDLDIVSKKIGEKKTAITRNSSGETKQVKLTPEKSREQVLTESEMKSLANLAIKIEHHYDKPQDIEFAIENTEIYITQSRPITTKAIESKDTEIKGEELLSGLGASPGIGSGKVRIIEDISELFKVEKGDVLVTKMTNPDMVVSMNKASAIITNEGGITSHAAIISREMGIPAVVGTKNATEVLKDNQEVTVDGGNGKVYSGKSEQKKVEIKPIIQGTKIKIKVIVDIPEAATRAALTKTDSVGLLRLEGIIAGGKKHPLNYEKENKLDEYEKLIEEGVTKILEHFREVWIRTSDIRTDEFKDLEGAPKVEGNPMLGDHGIRFSLKHPKILESEFKAVKNIAKKNPSKTLGIMMPQIMSVEEVEKAKEIANSINLLDEKNVKMGIMIETPASALIIKNLLRTGIKFVSFGTNDLTQYTLAIDRNNENVQNLFDETHPAVLNAIKRVLRTCQEFDVESSICGQAGSRKEMAKFLVENGINSISVNADAAYEISQYVKELESNIQTTQTENKEEKTPENKEKNKEGKLEEKTPENKVKEIERKIQREVTAEVISHPPKQLQKQEQPPLPEPNNPNPEPIQQKEKEKTPSYVADTIPEVSNQGTSDQEALKQLFGINDMASNMEEPKPKPIEPTEKEPEDNDEEDEVMDIF